MLTFASPSRGVVTAVGEAIALLAAARATTLSVTQGPRGGEWKRAFNPFRDDTDTRWPATAGVYEPPDSLPVLVGVKPR